MILAWYTFQIPDAKQRPAALLELLGGARCRAGVSGILLARDASTVCKIVVPMLLPAENTEDAEETEAGVPFLRIHPSSLFSEMLCVAETKTPKRSAVCTCNFESAFAVLVTIIGTALFGCLL